MDLTALGWDAYFMSVFAEYAAQGYSAARVLRDHRHIYTLATEDGEFTAEISGKLRHTAEGRADYPVVGDWVAVQPRPDERKATIHAVLSRKSAFVRKEAGGRTEEQVVAANVDTVFLVSGLDGDYNLRRMERYLSVAWDSGAMPVIVLNKADLCDDVASVIDEVTAIAIGVPILAVSAVEQQGLDCLREHVGAGKTAAFLGSSGVGKSTLINALLGSAHLEVSEVRADDSRGRHTTTHRELIPLPEGGVLMDTPGMRELQLWSDEAGVNRTFEDIEALAAQCRFADCSHDNEPGCRISEALETGELDADRLHSYRKLQRELQHLATRQDEKAWLAEKARDKAFGKKVKQVKKIKQDYGTTQDHS